MRAITSAHTASEENRLMSLNYEWRLYLFLPPVEQELSTVAPQSTLHHGTLYPGATRNQSLNGCVCSHRITG